MCCSCDCVDTTAVQKMEAPTNGLATIKSGELLQMSPLLVAGDADFYQRVKQAVGDCIENAIVPLVNTAQAFENALLKEEFLSCHAQRRGEKVPATSFDVVVVQYDKAALQARSALESLMKNQHEHRTIKASTQVVVISNQKDAPKGVGFLHTSDLSTLLFSRDKSTLEARVMEAEDFLGLLGS